MDIFYVFFGAGLGGVLRYFFVYIAGSKIVSQLPIGIILANMIGCFLGGIILFCCTKHYFSEKIFLFFVTGFLGGFTTFSAFGIETIALFQKNEIGLAFANIVLSFSSVLMTYLGYLLAKIGH